MPYHNMLDHTIAYLFTMYRTMTVFVLQYITVHQHIRYRHWCAATQHTL